MEMRVAELAERSAVSVRTVRFYHQTGVLPRPRMRGRVGWYGEEHFERLASVRRLQQRGYSLAAIADMVAAQVPDGLAQETVRLGLVAPAEGGADAGEAARDLLEELLPAVLVVTGSVLREALQAAVDDGSR